MRLALVDLPELFFIVDFYADPVLKHILDVLLLDYEGAVVVFRVEHFLEVLRVAPSHLD